MSSVYDCCSECPPSLFKYFSAIVVVSLFLARYLIPPDIAFQGPRTKDGNAIVSPPKRRVRDDDGWLWRNIIRCKHFMHIKLFANPHMTSVVFFSQFHQCLLASCVLIPNLFLLFLISLFVLKTMVTFFVFVSSSTTLPSVLFYKTLGAFRTYSSVFLCSIITFECFSL